MDEMLHQASSSVKLITKMKIPQKYELAVRFHRRCQDRLEKAYAFSTFKVWDTQKFGKFGFIPIESQILPQCQRVMQVTDNLLNIHKIVKATCTHNFMEAQVRVPSQLNVEVWNI